MTKGKKNKARNILIALSLKHNGDWDKIYEDIQNKTLVEDTYTQQAENIKNVITILDEEYPQQLKNSFKPPFVLFYKGNINFTEILFTPYYLTNVFYEDLIAKADVICLETNDGREHLWQAEKCFKAKKRVFIDKPIAQDYPHAKAICDLGRKYGAEYFSTSTLRYADANAAARASGTNFVSCIFFAPSPVETQGTHSRYVWYGIHAFETAMTVMGRGARSVRAYTAGINDFVTITWADGRVANLKLDQKCWNYGGYAFPLEGEPVPLCGPKGYGPMLKGAILPFFRTGIVPVPHEQTLEIFAIMDAAAKSHAEGGREVAIVEITGESD